MTRDLFGHMPAYPGAMNKDEKEITLTLLLHDDNATDKCVRVSEAGDESGAVLLPKSQIRITPTGRHSGRPGHPKYAVCEIVLPEWLALDRGLV